ncbi:MAG TPA: DoxX family protein [Acidimicrobiales bacterium]|nr:DoxX family protein [Acidimicrobiales bacterium]
MELGSRRVIVGLTGIIAADGAFNTVGLYDIARTTWWGNWVKNWTKEDLDHLEFPERLRFVFPIVKAMSVIGLLGGLRWRRLGRLTGLALVVYFVLAVGFHLRVRDSAVKSSPAAVMLVWCYLAWRAFGQRPAGSCTAASSMTLLSGIGSVAP